MAYQSPIEAARVALTRYMKREGQVWIEVFPDKPVTSKPAEVRMGKGKGALDHWVAVTRAGKIVFGSTGYPLRPRRRPCAWQPRSCRSVRSS